MNNFTKNFKNIPNPSKYVCNHLIGKEHTLASRVIIGIIIMFFGVIITKITLESSSLIVHILGDTLGFFLHGLGAIPLIEYFVHLNNLNREEEEEEELHKYKNESDERSYK